MEEVNEERARALGPSVENHQSFPNRINMQILKVIDRANIDIRIWERGAGYTLASGQQLVRRGLRRPQAGHGR